MQSVDNVVELMEVFKMRKALVVGINSYPKNPLSGCINDANDITNILERHENGEKNFSVKKKLDVPTKGELRSLIFDCFSGNADIALFYFSGHGYIDSVGGYLVTPDFSPHDWGVSMQEILTIINDSKCKNRIVIFDCCHSGFLGSINTSGQNTSTIGEGVTILTASLPVESAVEVNGRGVFTSLLIDALSGGASDITGHITPGGIYAYIDKSLGPWEQRPVFKTNVTRFLPLRNVKSQVSMDIIRKLTTYFSDANSSIRLDPSFEPTNSPTVKHDLIEPFADEQNTKIFSDLQKMEGVGLIVPCEEDHMYFAAMNSKACKLTSVGKHYWRLVKQDII